MSRRENVNTVIASAALTLSAITAWFQFGPVEDELEMARAQLKSFGVGGQIGEEASISFNWEVEIYNPSSRDVNIIDAAIARDDGVGAQLLPNNLASFEGLDVENGEPLQIVANGTRKYRLRYEITRAGSEATYLLRLHTADGSQFSFPLSDDVDRNNSLVDPGGF